MLYFRFLLAALVVVGSALVATADATKSQQDVVDQLNAYRAQLDAANAQWQADSIAALQNGQQPPPFPDVPYPNITAPGYDTPAGTPVSTPTGTPVGTPVGTPTGTATTPTTSPSTPTGPDGTYDPYLDPNNPLSEDF